MHARLLRRFLTVIVVVFAQFPALQAEDRVGIARHATLDDVVSKSRERHARIRTGRIEWGEACFNSVGSLISREWAEHSQAPDKLSVTPKEDITYSQTRVFGFSGSAKRFHQSTCLVFDKNIGQYEETRLLTTNGDARLTLAQPSAHLNYHYGQILPKKQRDQELQLLCLEPILQCYRLFDEQIQSADPSKYELDAEDSIVDGVHCVVVVNHHNKKLDRRFWLDPAREYLPIRFALENIEIGRKQRQTDFRYVQDNAKNWVLDRWIITSYTPDGAVKSSIDATVTGSELNEEIPDAEFTIEFPAGTIIDSYDERRSYKVEATGQHRPMQQTERATYYAENIPRDNTGRKNK